MPLSGHDPAYDPAMLVMMKRPVLRLLLAAPILAFVLLSMPPTPMAQEDAPRAVVEKFHETIVAVMKDAARLGHKGRAERLAPVIDRTFHLPTMIQVASGGAWRTASADQRDRLIAAFRSFSVATYANNFDDYGGERFETLGNRDGPQGTRIVETKIIKSDGGSVDIAYVLKESSAGWRAVDVVVDRGISELALRRSEYAAVLRTGGVDALISTLHQKADQLAAQPR